LGTLLALIVSLIFCGIFESALPLVLTIIVLLSLLVRYYWRGVQEGKKLMKAECCCVGPAVVGLSHHQFRGEMHTFRFNSLQYAEPFKQLNNAQPPMRFVS